MGRWERDSAGDGSGGDEHAGPYMDTDIQELLDEGDVQGALEMANQNVLRSPRQLGAWIDKGDVLYDMGRYYEASTAYGKALEIDAEQPELLVKKGVVHEMIGDYGSAFLCYSRATRLEPEDATAMTKKAHCLLHMGGGGGRNGKNPIGESIEMIRKVLRTDEYDVDALRVYYEALDIAGLHEDALEVATRLLEADSADTEHWSYRSEQMHRLGRYEGALSAADGAIKADPSSPAARTSRGLALAGLDRHAEAIESFDDSILLDPGSGRTWAGRAASLAALGRHDEAADAMFVAISVDPGSATALDDPIWKGMREAIVKRLGGRSAVRRKMAAGRVSSILRCGSPPPPPPSSPAASGAST